MKRKSSIVKKLQKRMAVGGVIDSHTDAIGTNTNYQLMGDNKVRGFSRFTGDVAKKMRRYGYKDDGTKNFKGKLMSALPIPGLGVYAETKAQDLANDLGSDAARAVMAQREANKLKLKKNAIAGAGIAASLLVPGSGALVTKVGNKLVTPKEEQEETDPMEIVDEFKNLKVGKKESLDEEAGLKKGGQIKGKGTGTSDSISAKLPKGGFVVPAKNAGIAKKLRKEMLQKKSGEAPLKSGDTKVKVSNGEHLFVPSEVKELQEKGVNLNALAPEAEHKLKDGGKVDPEPWKRKILAASLIASGKVAKRKFENPKNNPRIKTEDQAIAEGYKKGGKIKDDDDPKTSKYKKQVSEAKKKSDDDLRKKGEDANYIVQKKYLQEGYDALKKRKQEMLDAEARMEKLSQEGNTNELEKAVATYERIKKSYSDTDNQIKELEKKLPSGKMEQYQKDFQSEIESSGRQVKPKGPDIDLPGNKTGSSVEGGNEAAKTLTAALKNKTSSGGTGSGKSKSGIVNKIVAPTKYSESYQMSTPSFSKEKWEEGNKELADLERKDAAKLPGRNKILESNPNISQNLSTQEQFDETIPAEEGKNQGLASKFKKGYEGLGGAAGVASLVQAGAGIAGLLRQGKRPEYKIGQDVIDDVEQAKFESTFGFSDAEKRLAQSDIENARKANIQNILNLSNDAGTALANVRSTNAGSSRQMLEMRAKDAELKRAKQQYKSGLVNMMENRKRQQFEDKMNQFQQNQTANAELTNAGIANFIGNMERKNSLKAMEAIGKTGAQNYSWMQNFKM